MMKIGYNAGMNTLRFEFKPENWRAYLLLMRFDKPIGTLLLAYPVLWALWLGGQPQAHVVAIFLLGTFLMRSAGCVINDYADRDIDHAVARTQARPLTAGQVSERETLSLFVALVVLAASLLLFLPIVVFKVAILALAVAIFYPFSKRFFIAPQLVLGIAFSLSIPMAYVASRGEVNATAWLLFVANTLWTVMYDTWYALVDKSDDEKLDIHSTALTFGRHANSVIVALQASFVLLMLVVAMMDGLSIWYYVGLGLSVLCFVYQYHIGKHHDRDACFSAFLNNRWVGLFTFLGILIATLP